LFLKLNLLSFPEGAIYPKDEGTDFVTVTIGRQSGHVKVAPIKGVSAFSMHGQWRNFGLKVVETMLRDP
jgi:hypothetical protein